METHIEFEILPQPSDVTCGPTCLHALYRYYGDLVPLDRLVAECPQVEGGGTLAVFLASHALRRGYSATIFTYNLQVFDPTWFRPDAPPLAERLRLQMEAKGSPKLKLACEAYLQFLDLGGVLIMEDLDAELLRRYLTRSTPILTGLSATYLYQEAREAGPPWRPDDVHGSPAGHFVVLCGYDRETRSVLVADPLHPNPLAHPRLIYEINYERVICAILLGIVTYDANLLVIQPSKPGQRRRRAERHRGQ